MESTLLSVREIELSDVSLILDYWLTADAAFLHGMGADIAKLPARPQYEAMLAAQLSQPYPEKQAYCIIWQIDGQPVGHSNVNKIVFGQEASMHLHLWQTDNRKKGCGTDLVRMTIPFFFKNLELKYLYCEPYALNPAPNRVLEKAGFSFVRQYVTTPGWINFEQPVNRWEITREQAGL